MGLGILAVKARRVTDVMFMSAAEALSNCSPALVDPQGSLLPPLDDIRKVSRKIAVAVALQAQLDGVADAISQKQLQQSIDANGWEPRYYSLIPQASK